MTFNIKIRCIWTEKTGSLGLKKQLFDEKISLKFEGSSSIFKKKRKISFQHQITKKWWAFWKIWMSGIFRGLLFCCLGFFLVNKKNHTPRPAPSCDSQLQIQQWELPMTYSLQTGQIRAEIWRGGFLLGNVYSLYIYIVEGISLGEFDCPMTKWSFIQKEEENTQLQGCRCCMMLLTNANYCSCVCVSVRCLWGAFRYVEICLSIS